MVRAHQDSMAERPLECSECKKPLSVDYTEVVGDHCNELSMCSECPVWQKKVHGTREMPVAELDVSTDLCCGNCGTSLDIVRTGNPVGCAECYEVFGDVIAADLIASMKASHRIGSRPMKGTPLHHGRSPAEEAKISPAIELVALNEALSETLSSENYEQAAWLRDQIDQLKGKIDES